MNPQRTMLANRRRGSGTLPGMAPAAGPLSEDATVAAPEQPDPKPPPGRAQPGRTQNGRDTTGRNEGRRRKTPSVPLAVLTFGGAQKITVSTRTYRCVWDAYNELAAELTAEGRGRVYQNDVLNAVLAVCLPADAAEARDRLARYRAMLEADPPRDLRTLS